MKYIILFFTLFVLQQIHGQTNNPVDSILKKIVVDHIEKTPTKSGLSYSTLTKFFQSSITTGKNGGFDFKTSLFGLKKLFAKNDSLDFSNYYLNHKVDRNLEFSLGAYTNTNGQLNTTIGGIKYALINHRSKAVYDFSSLATIETSLKTGNDVINSAINKYVDTYIKSEKDIEKQNKLNVDFNNKLKAYTKKQSFSMLPIEMQNDIAIRLKDLSSAVDTSNFFSSVQKQYNDAAKAIDNRALLTLSFNPGYDWVKSRFDTTSINLQYLIGISKNHDKPWTFNGQFHGIFQHDSTSTSKSLSRFVSVVSLGVNKTLVNDGKENPLIEFEFAFENDYVHNGLYAKEEQDKLTLNTILRIHLSKEISIPLTLKYDLKNPNLFGFIKFDWNFQNK